MAARASTPTGCSRRSSSRFYAERFDTVELNATGYRLPSEDQFRRWAEAVPDGFRFAVKLPLTRLDRVTPFLERVAALGDRLGPVRVVVEAARDEGLVAFVTGSAPPGAELAWDFRHESWATAGRGRRARQRSRRRAVPLPAPPRAAVHRRRPAARSPATVRAPAYVYLRHEDEPTAPAYAARLRELLDLSG